MTVLNNDFFNQNLRTCCIRGLGLPRFVHAKRKPHVSGFFYIAWSDFLSVHKSFVLRVDNIFLETSSVPSLFALKVVRYLPLINRIRNPQICTRDCSINQFWAFQTLSHALNHFETVKLISCRFEKILVAKYSGLGIFPFFQND